MLKCIGPSEVWYILAEIHEGSSSLHGGGKALARKALRASYFWPTMNAGAATHVKTCNVCQLHAPLGNLPGEDLHSMSSRWPFHTWNLDLLGPFDAAPGQLKHLLVAVDYFTKWIEAKPSSTVTSDRAQNFVFRTIICRFGNAEAMVNDNGTQFTDKGFREILSVLQIKHHFASVAHPQSNGQAEAANKVIVEGLRKRCRMSGCN